MNQYADKTLLGKGAVPDSDAPIYSFLMVGQSNMAGRGKLDGAPILSDSRCLTMRMGRWQAMTEPVNLDRSPFPGFGAQSGAGPAPRFAQLYAEIFDRRVGLIPCADGGTCIDQWAPGSILFDHAVFQAKLAMRTSKLSGILWHQGEADCKKMEDVLAYPEKFLCTMKAFLQQLGEDLPIVIGELGRPELGFYSSDAQSLIEFNRRLPELAAQLPRCRVASSEGLPCQGDGFHFGTADIRKLGERYFEAYKSLCPSGDL